jgi:NAD(P)-dependent dehydrogenase (short-subunit alcohol dehydrogenase family)
MGSNLGLYGIGVNAFVPGQIDTAMPLADEAAKVIYLLCMAILSYVNGAEVHINKGGLCEYRGLRTDRL